MPLIDDNDIQVHLPVDKLKLEDIPDSVTEVKLDVERIIKGHLSGTFAPLTLAGWSTPGSTPEYVRAIGGRLAAALLYRLRLSQDYPDDSAYALLKYSEGMDMLNLVVAGSVTLPEVVETVDTGAHLSVNHFTELPDPKFTMDDVY
jgi:hypothetical protein